MASGACAAIGTAGLRLSAKVTREAGLGGNVEMELEMLESLEDLVRAAAPPRGLLVLELGLSGATAA